MTSLLDTLVWIDNRPWIWKPLDFSLAATCGAMALAPLFGKVPKKPRAWWQGARLFWLLLGFAILACRFPAFFIPKYLNIDEAMLIAQALTYQHYPVPWLDVDPTTNGPLNGYALLWSIPFGLQPCYVSARLTALFCNIGLLFFLYLVGRGLAGEVFARISILPILLYFCFPYYADCACYSNEQVLLLLIGWSVYLLTGLRRQIDSVRALMYCGVVLGLLPWAKLQSVTASLALGLIAGVFILVRLKQPISVRLVRCTLLLLATMLPTLSVLLILACFGSLSDFWISYIEMARNYGGHFNSLSDDLSNRLLIIYHVFAPDGDMAMSLYLTLGLGSIVAVGLLLKTLKASLIARDWYLASMFFPSPWR